MSRIIQFAVVGCGHIGKRHAEMIKRNAESELVALVDIKKSEELNIDVFGVPLYPSIDEMLKSPLMWRWSILLLPMDCMPNRP